MRHVAYRALWLCKYRAVGLGDDVRLLIAIPGTRAKRHDLSTTSAKVQRRGREFRDSRCLQCEAPTKS